MKYFFLIFITLGTELIYSNPIIPTIRISEFGFTKTGWIIEIAGEFWVGPQKFVLHTNSGVSDTFHLSFGGSLYYIITNDTINNSVNINPDGDTLYIVSPGYNYSPFYFSKKSQTNIAPHVGQSICVGHKPLGKTFYYLDNSPTFGAENDSAGAFGKIKGMLVDSSGHPIKNAKVFYDYETAYGGGDIYVYTNDSGYFFINHFAEAVTLKFKKEKFFSEKINIHIYPDSTIDLKIVLNTDFLSGVEREDISSNYRIEQNYPNPFNPVTTIRYNIPELAFVSLKVFDVLGREVTTLVQEIKTTGDYDVEFNASNLANGIYIYQLQVRNYTIMKKMVVLK